MRYSGSVFAALAALTFVGPAGRGATAATPFCDVQGDRFPVSQLAPAGEVRTTGIQRLLFLRVRFADDVSDPVTEQEAWATLGEVDRAFRRMSEGAFGLVPTVTPVLRLRDERAAYSGPGGFDRLIDDARAAGTAAGYAYQDYDLEVVRHSGVPGLAGGNARLGARGAQVQVGGAGILLHELGHNLGLSHANFWSTSGPGVSRSSPPLPSHYERLPEPRSIPVFPDSAVGHETILGPGAALEYGDTWDIMGVGDADFSVTYKEYLGWLSARHDAGQSGGQRRRHPRPGADVFRPGIERACECRCGGRRG